MGGARMKDEKASRTYADTREEQVEFEELVEEEKGDWQAAAKDVAEGRKPRKDNDKPPFGNA
jgi:hypothetical protein